MKLLSILILSVLCVKSEEELQCPPGSLNHMRVLELLEKSNTGPGCLNEARNVFKKVYNPSNFIFEDRNDPAQKSIVDFGFSVYIRDDKLVKNVFNVFGDLINIITVSCDKLRDAKAKEIVKEVNDRCSDSLKRLTLERCIANNLEQFRNVFTKVNTLTFSSSYSKKYEVNPNSGNWTKHFPNVNSMTLGTCKIADWTTFIDGKYPDLIRLVVYLPETNDEESINDSHIANFIKANRHIEHLSVFSGNIRLFKNVSEYLRGLETLEILFLKKDDSNFNESIQFDSVKNFRFHLGYEVPENIVLNQVRNLRIWLLSGLSLAESSKWTHFVTNKVHENLTEVELKSITITREQFISIPVHLPQLEKLDILCINSPVLYADDIINYIANSTKLNHLQVNGISIEEKERARLQEILKDEWFTLITPTNINILKANAGGANSLVVSHAIQMLAICLIVAFFKWL